METIHPLFIAELRKKYVDRFTIEMVEKEAYIVFPAKSHVFGTIDIWEDYPGGYIVFVGNFTHCHFDCFEGSEEDQIKEAAEHIIIFLENIFNDNVICFGSHQGSGGCYVKDHEKDTYISKNYDQYFVWSGKISE